MESRFCPKINESVLLRYFTKQLTDREAECVEEWIQASEKNRQIARDVHYILFATTTWSNLRKTSSEKALRQVKRKMLRKRSWLFAATKLLQKREMRKDIVIELSYKGFSRASDYS